MKRKFILIICCLSVGLAGVAAAIFPVGYFLGLIPSSRAMVVLSGSMAPELKVGSLAIVAKADNYLTNEIISFSPSGDLKDIVTHRIVAKEYPEGIEKSPIFLTAGDANKNFDFKKLKQEQIIGKVIFSIPYLGYIANFFKEPYGFILFFIVPVTIIVYEELKTLKKEIYQIARKFIPKDRGVIEDGRIRLRGKVLFFFPILVAALALTSFSVSFFSDREDSVSNSFVAGEWVPTSTPTETPTPTPTPTPITDHLVINELYYDVCSDAGCGGSKGNDISNEWVEIYNPTYNSVDISGWKICDNTGCETILSSSPIPASGFAIITPQSSTWPYWSIPSSAIKIALGTSNIGSGFHNNNDRAILKKADNTEIDKMSYGSDAYAFNPACTDVAEGHSLERSPAGKDTDTAGDFVDRTNPTPGN